MTGRDTRSSQPDNGFGERTSAQPAEDARGWYGPPDSRRWHYFDEEGRSLCGKWLVLAWSAQLVDRAIGQNVSGYCASCKRRFEASAPGTGASPGHRHAG